MNGKVLIIYTGGTIGMARDPQSGTLVPVNYESLAYHVPELETHHLRVEVVSFHTPVDSSNIGPIHWGELARMIFERHDLYDGFVILHGSDTMAYTASALSFMLRGLKKPVILTGSQLPIGVLRTDAKENLLTAVEIAAAKKEGKAIVPEVCIYFENCLFRGNRSVKFHSENFDAFRSPNYPMLAEAGVHLKFQPGFILLPDENAQLICEAGMNTNVALIKLFPGLSKEVVRAMFETKDLEAVVISTFGSGNMPQDSGLVEIFDEYLQKGMHIINVTQCIKGGVEQGRYETSTLLDSIGVIPGGDITTEAALTKMMHILANIEGRDEQIHQFKTPYAGEITIPV